MKQLSSPKFPAYGKSLADRQRFNNLPFLVIVCIGGKAWQDAKRWSLQSDVAALVLAADQNPDSLTWPVNKCLCVIDWSIGPAATLIIALVRHLLKSGAKSVTVRPNWVDYSTPSGYYDTKDDKLICRVSASGNKSFCLLKRTTDGKLQRVTLGKCSEITVDDARKKAAAALADLDKGINPAEEKRRLKVKQMTLAELMTRYIEQKGLKLSSGTAADYQKKLGEGFPDWLDKPVNAITREMVAKRHKTLPGNSTSKDNKMRILRLLMNSALALKIIDESPTDVLKKAELDLWSKPTRKSRIIPADKLHDWYGAVLELTNPKAKTYLLLLLYTGLRANEALHLEWKNVDFKNDTLTVMDTKNHSNFTTYIPMQLKPYLRNLQDLTGGNTFVFPGDNAEGVMAIPRWPLDQVTLKTGVEFSSHDLRRTFATIAEASLLPETIIKKLLNHITDNNVTGGYIRTEANTMKQAVDRIAGFIQEHVTPDGDNIVNLKNGTK